jgi:hypothetical protein
VHAYQASSPCWESIGCRGLLWETEVRVALGAPANTNLSIDTILQSIRRLASGGIAMSCVSRPRSLVLNACVD